MTPRLAAIFVIFFFSSRRRHTRSKRDWSSDVCSSDLVPGGHLVVDGGGDVARAGQIHALFGRVAAQPYQVDGGARLAQQAVLDGVGAAHGAHVGVVDGGDVVARLDAGLLRGRAVIDFQHLGVAGLVLGHLHADAHQHAVLDVQQLGVGVGGVVAGVPVAGAHQIAGGNGVDRKSTRLNSSHVS